MTNLANISYVLVPNIGYFIFDIDGTTTHTLESDITDHYTENNTAIQDHWALKPEKITLKNYQGELVTNSLIPILTAKTQLKITNRVISPLLTMKTNNPQQIQKQKVIEGNTINNLNFNNIVLNNTIGLRQQSTYNFFKNIRNQRILVSCNTPYGYLENMAIENIIPFQDEDTKYISTFTMTLKQMHFIDIILVPYDPKKLNTNNTIQQQDNISTKQNGVQVGALPKIPTTTVNFENYTKNNFTTKTINTYLGVI